MKNNPLLQFAIGLFLGAIFNHFILLPVLRASVEPRKTTETTTKPIEIVKPVTPPHVESVLRENISSLLKLMLPQKAHYAVDAKEMKVLENQIDPKAMEDSKELIASEDVMGIPMTWLMPSEGLQPEFPIYLPNPELTPIVVPEPADSVFTILSLLMLGILLIRRK